MKSKKRICSECKTPVEGRANKIFCSKTCRNKHNNKIAKAKKEESIHFRFSGQTP